MLIEKELQKALDKRQHANALRTLTTPARLIDFASNDYLGLARNKSLYEIITKRHAAIPANGSTGSRLLSGNHCLYEEVEQQLADCFNSDCALIFNSGYSANLAVISSIPKKGDTIIYDELAHACIKDGARLSMANRYSFRHNDLSDLEQKIKKSTGNVFVIVESIYSMDGDECPLIDLIALTSQYGANIIIDEAHATGIYGHRGSGLSGHLGVDDKLFARIYTFGKAMGVHGAAVAGSQTLVNYLINFARPFIYTTSLSPHSVIAISSAFKYLDGHQQLQSKSIEKVHYFNEAFHHSLADKYEKVKSKHPIQSIIISGNDQVRAAANVLNIKGFDIRPILSPTVKKGEERLRICLHTYNSDDEISHLIDTLAAI